jgi:putative permease
MNLPVKSISTREILKIIMFSLLMLGAVTALFSMRRLFIPLGLAYLGHLILAPIIPTITRFGVGRTAAIWILMGGLLTFSIIPVVKIAPHASQEIENVQFYIPKVENYVRLQFDSIQEEVGRRTGYEINEKYLNEGVGFAKKWIGTAVLQLPQYIATLLEWAFLVPLFLFFMLVDGSSFKRLILRLVPNSIFERFYNLTYQFNKQLGDYIFAKFIEASIVGVIISVGLLIMDVRFSFLLGLVAAITNVIPYVGPVIGSLPGILIALAEYGVSGQFWAIAILYLIANAIDIALVFPLLVSKIVDLHPMVVVISVIIGSVYFGVLGMVLSIPVTAALKLVFLEIHSELYQDRLR